MAEPVRTIDGLRMRRVMGVDKWMVPTPFGPDGWQMDHKVENGRVLATCAPWAGYEMLHASMAFKDRLPTYDDLALLHKAVWPNGYAYQVFTPDDQHVNIHEFALHLWGRSDGVPMLPLFGMTLPSGQRSI